MLIGLKLNPVHLSLATSVPSALLRFGTTVNKNRNNPPSSFPPSPLPPPAPISPNRIRRTAGPNFLRKRLAAIRGNVRR